MSNRIYYVDDLTEEPVKSVIDQIQKTDDPYDIYRHENYDEPLPSFCYFSIDCMMGNCCNYPKVCGLTDYCHIKPRKVELENFRYYQNIVKCDNMITGEHSAIWKNVSFYGKYRTTSQYGFDYYGDSIAEPGWMGILDTIESIDSSVISVNVRNGALPMLGTHYSTDNVNNAYWFKRDDDNYAFAEFGYDYDRDPNDDGTVFKPFTSSQTDEVVTALGEKWTKKLVQWNDPETGDNEEFYIPWVKLDSDE